MKYAFITGLKSDRRSSKELQSALQLMRWVVPVLMAIIGISYTLFEYGRHVGDPRWRVPTYLGFVVLGLIGPALAFLCIHWINTVAAAYLAAQEKLSRRADELAALNRLSVAAGRSLDLEKTFATIIEQTMEALDAEASMVFVQQNGRPGLRLEAHRGISVNMAQQEAHLAPGHCLCGQSVESRRVLFAGDVGDDPRCTSDLCICEGFRSVACAPLEVKGQLVGLLQLASPEINHFTADQEDFLAAAAAQVSIFVENARLYDTVRTFNVELEKKINQRTSELEGARWALAEKARQLQRLLNESYRVQEDTQSRIAQDMHDGVTQIIIGALYETQAAREALIDDPDRAAESLMLAQQLLTEVEVEIRRVIYDLHPPVLDMMGLVIALKRFAVTFTAAFDAECRIHVSGRQRRLPKDVEIAVYRIIQAALHNVASHAQASRVDVRFDFGDAALNVVIEDDGVGFDPYQAMETPGEHLGLIGMKERAEAIGAGLDVISQPGLGTRIVLRLPSPGYLVL